MEFNPENFKRFKKNLGQQEQSLLAIPIEEQKFASILRNRNPIIKDMESEILDMKNGDWNDLTPEQKAQLRKEVWKK